MPPERKFKMATKSPDKRQIFPVKLSPAEKSAYRMAAAAKGVHLAAWIRGHCSRAATREAKKRRPSVAG